MVKTLKKVSACPETDCEGKGRVEHKNIVRMGVIMGTQYFVRCRFCGFEGPKRFNQMYAKKAWEELER